MPRFPIIRMQSSLVAKLVRSWGQKQSFWGLPTIYPPNYQSTLQRAFFGKKICVETLSCIIWTQFKNIYFATVLLSLLCFGSLFENVADKLFVQKIVLKIMSIIQRLIDNGNIEELFLHEGSHISLDRLIEVHKISLKLLLLSFKKDMKSLRILTVDFFLSKICVHLVP